MSRLRKITVLVGANLVILVLVLSGLELGLRWVYDPLYAPRPDFEVAHPSTVWANASNLHHDYYGSDFSQKIVTDGFGNRLDSLGPAKPDDSLVLLAGDSYTFGWGVSGDDTFAAYIDRRLAEARPGWRAVNLGVPGFGTLAVAQRLEEYLRTVDCKRVKAIVVFHADNDPVDNVLYVLYKGGFRFHHLASSPHSEARVVNVFSRVWHAVAAPRTRSSGEVDWEGGSLGDYQKIDISQETDLALSKTKPHYTPLQLHLMRWGVDKLNQACAGSGLPIHHIILNLGPGSESYVPAMLEAFTDQDPHGNDVHYHGLMPLGNWDPNVSPHNRHSGGHFTPTYNRHCGEIFFGLIFPGVK